MSVIEVNHVTKEYRLGQLASFKDNMTAMLARLRGQHAPERKPFKALDDIDFKVEQGEVVGIIGQNGAGKSTLLKILSSVVRPTSGSMRVKGKIAPLIEVGAGMVGDLTGRENIFLNSSILGIPRAEIKKKQDEIISFAELEEFIDTPVKRYSTGMLVRLGFAIATSIEAEILIVDEVLAVGDLAFQRKCFDKMEDLIKKQNKTVLIVGHNIRQLERLSTRMILFNNGKVIIDGAPKDVATQYYLETTDKVRAVKEANKLETGRILSSGDISDMDVHLLNPGSNEICSIFELHDPMKIDLKFESKIKVDNAIINIGFHTDDFVYISTFSSAAAGVFYPLVKGLNTVSCYLADMPLNPGSYNVRVSVMTNSTALLWHGENLVNFSVVSTRISRSMLSLQSLIDIPVKWEEYKSCSG